MTTSEASEGQGPRSGPTDADQTTDRTTNGTSIVVEDDSQAQGRCEICGRVFRSHKGLRQHCRRSHPSTYHRDLAEHLATVAVEGQGATNINRVRWSKKEGLLAAEADILISNLPQRPGKNEYNRMIQEVVGAHRTLESIDSRRRTKVHRQMVNEHRERIERDIVRQQTAREVAETEDESPTTRRLILDSDSTENCRLELASAIIDSESRDLDGIVKLEGGVIGLEPWEAVELRFNRWLKSIGGKLAPPRDVKSAGDDNYLEPNDRADLGRRRWKSKRLAITQRLFKRNPSSCVNRILDSELVRPTSTVTNSEQESFWRQLFEAPSKEVNLKPDRCLEPDYTLARPLTVNEVALHKKRLRKSAPSWDGVTVELLRKVDNTALTAWYNVFLLYGQIPKAISLGRTTLIPKQMEASSPAEFRPITVSSMLLRLFHRALEVRLSSHFDSCYPTRQRGFRKVDGCAENLALLDAVLARARNDFEGTSIVFCDVKKAFDSVSHRAIRPALERLGVPPLLINYVEGIYGQARVRISTSADSWDVNSGVLQGCPLSGYLFTAVLELVVEGLPIECGLHLGGGQILTHGLFADDAFLASESPTDLNALLQVFAQRLGEAGMALNPAKCRSLHITASKKRKAWACDSRRPFLSIGSDTVPVLGVAETYKYLGVRVSATGIAKADVRHSLLDKLERVSRSALSPQQRLYALRVHILPSFEHVLVLNKVGVGVLKDLDREVRRFVRSWVHLPKDTPIGAFHAKHQDGGLGVRSFFTTIPNLRIRRNRTILSTVDPVLKQLYAAAKTTFPKLISTTFSGFPLTMREANRAAWQSSLHASVDGRGLGPACDPRSATDDWIIDPTISRTGQEFVRAVHVRLNLLRTPERKCRGTSRPSPPKCPVCSDKTDTLSHQLQVCGRTHGMRIRRHQVIVDAIAQQARKQGFDVAEEPRITVGRTFVKPDLVLTRVTNGKPEVLVLDPTIVADNYSFDSALLQKQRSYNIPPVIEFAKDRLFERTGRYVDLNANEVLVSGIVMNWRGQWDKGGVGVLRTRLHFSRRYLNQITLRVLSTSWHMARLVSNRTA